MDLGIKIFKLTQEWNVLYIRGYFFADSPTEKVEIYSEDGTLLGNADLNWRHVNLNVPEEKYRGWIFEKVLGKLPDSGHFKIIAYDSNGGKCELIQEYTRKQITNDSLQGQKRTPNLNKTISTNEEVISQRENIVFLVIHNLDVEERVEKLKTFEKIDAYLKQFNWKLLVIHHSPFEISSSLDYVQFNEFSPNESEIQPEVWETVLDPDIVHESTHLLHGFQLDTGTPRKISDCMTNVIREGLVFDKLIRHFKPYSCLLWHEWNSFMHLNKSICQKYDIPYFFVHEGFLPHTLGIDKAGEMAESWPATRAEKLRKLPINQEDLKSAEAYLNYAKKNDLERKPQTAKGLVKESIGKIFNNNRPTLFYAGVNDWMTGMLPVWWDMAKTHSQTFIDTYDALNYLLDLCEKNDWNLLFKPHPNIQARFEYVGHPRLLTLSSANIIDCIENSDLVVTLLSTVSYISMIHDSPVVLLGKNTLNGTGSVYEAKDLPSVEETIQKALKRENFDEIKKLWTRHVASLFRYYLFPYSDEVEKITGKTFKDAARFILKYSQGRQKFLSSTDSPENTMSNIENKTISNTKPSTLKSPLQKGIDNILEKLGSKPRKLAIYGGGKHTVKLLNKVDFTPHPVSIVIDDFSTGSINGVPVISPANIAKHDIDDIIISSDSIELKLLSLALKFAPEKVQVHTIYYQADKVTDPCSFQSLNNFIHSEFKDLPLINNDPDQSQYFFFHNLYRICQEENTSPRLKNFLLKCCDPSLRNFNINSESQLLNEEAIINCLADKSFEWDFIDEKVDIDKFAEYFREIDYPKEFEAYSKQYCRSLSRKAMEHFLSFYLLDVHKNGSYLDIAASTSPVHDILEKKYSVEKAYFQDLNFDDKPHPCKIVSPASSIPLESSSLDGITLHNSWEHFEGSEDLKCIEEAGRLLKSGGRLCILPLAFSEETEVLTSPLIWNSKYRHLKGVPEFDKNASIFINEQKLQRQEKTYSVEYFNEILAGYKEIFDFNVYYFSNIRNDKNDLAEYKDDYVKVGTMIEFPYLVLIGTKK